MSALSSTPAPLSNHRPGSRRLETCLHICRARHKLFVVTAFMRSCRETGRSDPMNRVTTNGFDGSLPDC